MLGPRPAQEATTYYFDVSPDCLRGALDRFAQFFTCPLVKQDAMEREVEAVNNEFTGVQPAGGGARGQPGGWGQGAGARCVDCWANLLGAAVLTASRVAGAGWSGGTAKGAGSAYCAQQRPLHISMRPSC